jgi:hypothetical protein
MARKRRANAAGEVTPLRAGRASATGLPGNRPISLRRAGERTLGTLRSVQGGGSAETAGNYPLETVVSQGDFVAGWLAPGEATGAT